METAATFYEFSIWAAAAVLLFCCGAYMLAKLMSFLRCERDRKIRAENLQATLGGDSA